jgi:hypothetical protein
MWKAILRQFEFEYADGYLFWDKAGRVARDLAQAIPGLALRNQLIDQRDFFLPASTLELLFGIRLASVRSSEEDAAEFRKQASLLLEILSHELELEALTRFRFVCALGWPCQTHEEAHALAMKLLPQEVARDLKTGEFQAAQLEVRKGAVLGTTRYAIGELSPPPGPARPDVPGPRIPYVIASVFYNRFETVPIREFKPTAVLEDVEQRFITEMSKQISPQAYDHPA